MIDLKKLQQEQTLVTDYGDPVYISGDYSLEGAFLRQGYEKYSFNLESTRINTDVLKKEFEPHPDCKKLIGVKDKLTSSNRLYKHKKQDFYIKIGGHEGEIELWNIFYKDAETTEKICNKLLKEVDKGQASVSIIRQTQFGFEAKSFEIKTYDVDIDKVYNDDFKPVYKHTLDKLKNDNKGVILFYGVPGSGKTACLKYLTTQVDKKFLFIPQSLIPHLTAPNFIDFLIGQKNSVLILEDCENYIEDREKGGNSVVSTLLQITDGLLSDIVGIQIICTFNTSLSNIDPALLRSGRLISQYEFKELSEKKTKALAGENYKGQRTLADIFNTLSLESSVGKKQTRNKVGFN